MPKVTEVGSEPRGVAPISRSLLDAAPYNCSALKERVWNPIAVSRLDQAGKVPAKRNFYQY